MLFPSAATGPVVRPEAETECPRLGSITSTSTGRKTDRKSRSGTPVNHQLADVFSTRIRPATILPMRTLAIVLGQLSDEQATKRYFKPYTSRPRSSEWFAAGEHMRSYLRWLRDLPFVARGEIDLDRLHPVDASEWLPDGKRMKHPTQLRLEDAGGWEDAWADLELDHVTEGDFYTHPSFIEAARQAMGAITLDPASCFTANEIVNADRFFSFHENGLLQDWAGRVWLNPPYGNWDEWAPKTLSEWDSGRIEAMCVLATTRVITAQHFHALVERADGLFVARGRFRFWGPKAKEPDEGHVVFYFGSHVDEFADAFSSIGTTFKEATT